MASSLLRRGIAVAALALLAPLASCGSDSTGPSGGSATITFWTSDSSPSYIAVVLDGSNVGTLSAYRTSAPVCGSSSSGAVSVTVSAGTHTYSAYETSSTGTWPAKSISLASGDCKTVEFLP